jgi:hypothetical protein
MSEKIVEDLIAKYLAGNASIEEIAQLDKWYEALSQTDLYAADSPELKLVMAKRFEALKQQLGMV